MKTNIYNNFFNDLIHIFPSINDILNLKEYNHLNHFLENSFSEEHKYKQKMLFKTYMKKILDLKQLNIYDKTLLYECKNSLKSFEYDFDLMPINHQENILISIMELGSTHSIYSFDSKKDYENIVKKMENLECITNSIMFNMQKGIKNKITLPKIIAIKLLEQFQSFKKNKSYKNTNIKYKLDFDFNKKIEDLILPSLNKIIYFLKNIYIHKCRKSIGLCSIKNGKNMYKFIVKNNTTLNSISIDFIHNYGLKEVERIHKEMMDIKEQHKFNGSLKEFSKYLKNLDRYKFRNKNDVINTYQNEISFINKDIIPKLFYSKVKNIDCKVKPVPSFNEEFSPEAYYIPGDLNNKRKGTFYVNMRNIKDNNKLEVESLTLHEANPGHHYQLTYVNESKTIPMFLKFNGSEAYMEGWALYCESLGEYRNNESYFGKLILEMLRALRLVVDTGIHYYNWSYDKTFNYYKKYSFDSDPQIKTQIFRYMAIPGQALAYKIGEKVILDIHKKESKKKDFNIKKFHEKILENGAVPLFLLKEKFK